MKRILALFLVVVCLICIEPLCSAKNCDQSKEYWQTPDIGIIKDKIEHYLSLNFEDDGHYFMSSLITIYSKEGKRMNAKAVFALHNTNIIGILLLDNINGQYCSSFLPIEKEKSDGTLSFSSGVSLYATDDSMEMYVNNKCVPLYGEKFAIKSIMPSNNVETYPITFALLNEAGSGKGSVGSIINVPSVQNAVNPHNSSHYLCWAACIASIVRYKTSSYSSLSATQVCYDLAANYPIPPCGYFSSNDIPQAFSIYGISYTYQSYGMVFNSMKTRINQSKPIYAGIVNSYGTSSHAVVICGYKETTDSHYYIYLMDPNLYPYVEVEITNPNNSSFYYVSVGNTYTTWQHAYY